MSHSYLGFFHIVLWKWFFLNTKVFYMASCFFFFFSHADTDNKKTIMRVQILISFEVLVYLPQ